MRASTAPLEVREAGKKGLGVFAHGPVKAGDVLERVPVLLFSPEEWEAHGKHTRLAHYTFNWEGGRQALALGTFGSMWNHDARPNVGFVREVAHGTLRFVALRDIQVGEECCISYGSQCQLWFSQEADTRSSSDSENENWPLAAIDTFE